MGKKKDNSGGKWSAVPTKQQQQSLNKKVKEEKKAVKQEKKKQVMQQQQSAVRSGTVMDDWKHAYVLSQKDAVEEIKAYEVRMQDFYKEYPDHERKTWTLVAGPELVHPWWYWRSRRALPLETEAATESSKDDEQIALTQHDGESLVALLQHYPFIVYLGVSFWRKMLIRLGGVNEGQNMIGFEASSFPPLGRPRQRTSKRIDSTLIHRAAFLESQDNEAGPSIEHLARMGYLQKLGDYIPNEFIRGLKPCTVKNLADSGKGERERKNGDSRYWPNNKFGLFFYGAIHAGQTDIVHLIVAHLHPDLNEHHWENLKYEWDWTPPLCVAVEAGRSDIVRLLVQQGGADPYYQGEYHFSTNLHTAVGAAARWKSGAHAMLETLLRDCGMDVNSHPKEIFDDKMIGNPLQSFLSTRMETHELQVKKDPRVVGGREPTRPGEGPAQVRDLCRVVKILLQCGAETAVWNQKGDAPLHQAVRMRDSGEGRALVLELLAGGADPNLETLLPEDNPCTALQIALKNGDEEMALLLRHGGAK